MQRLMAITGAGLALFAPLGDAGVSSDKPDKKVTVGIVTVNGSGCAGDSAEVAMSPDNTAFTVTYSEYMAQAGGAAKPTDMRKNCQLVVNVKTPQGFTYAVTKVDYRGFANLHGGASAIQRAGYYFQGNSGTSYRTHSFRGPMDGNWQTTDQTSAAKLVWARCGAQRYLNINTELRVNASGDKTSFISMDSTDGSVSTIYSLSWKRCR